MAYTAKDFERDLAAYSAGAVIGVTRSRKFIEYAAKRGIQLAALGTRRAAIPAARGVGMAARRYPLSAAALAGYGAYRAGAFDPVEEAIEMEVERRLAQAGTGAVVSTEPTMLEFARTRTKRKVSAYSKGVKAGMKALKASKFNGKPGKLTNAKKAFGMVSKTVSALRKGKKVKKTGGTGVVSRSASKVPGIKSIKVRK
jgi:hypothetical protein